MVESALRSLPGYYFYYKAVDGGIELIGRSTEKLLDEVHVEYRLDSTQFEALKAKLKK